VNKNPYQNECSACGERKLVVRVKVPHVRTIAPSMFDFCQDCVRAINAAWSGYGWGESDPQ
jgi:hypothetical protein